MLIIFGKMDFQRQKAQEFRIKENYTNNAGGYWWLRSPNNNNNARNINNNGNNNNNNVNNENVGVVPDLFLHSLKRGEEISNG